MRLVPCIFSLSTLVLTGCGTTVVSGGITPRTEVRVAADVEMKLEIGPELVGTAVLGAGESPKKFSDAVLFSNASTSGVYSDRFFTIYRNANEVQEQLVKSAAVYNALDGKAPWEFLLNPRYEFSIDQGIFTVTWTCTVRGTAARVVGYQQLAR